MRKSNDGTYGLPIAESWNFAAHRGVRGDTVCHRRREQAMLDTGSNYNQKSH